jgi:predicted lactoylglutathione lyase
MANQLFVNLPVKDLERSQSFFTELGFAFFGMAPGMASIAITATGDAQVMLLEEPIFAQYTSKPLSDPATSTQAILVLGLEDPSQVDELVDKALAAGATPAGTPQTEGRYQRGFADLDGHHWEALCLVAPAG